ncbi:MAG: 50S ribosomal protein L17 [candidate division Zixibacteria bacterium]|nr:50S ribosomal protein L17 [candidate division Zixibacteria bacterium]
MLANMATSLFLHEKITTTTPKAKALRPLVDRLITTARRGTLHSQRQVARTIRSKEALKKLFQEIVPQLDERNSGYSRVLKAGFRKGDGAELSVVELLVTRPTQTPTVEKKEGRFKKLAGRLRKSPGAKPPAEEKEEAKQKEAATEEMTDGPETTSAEDITQEAEATEESTTDRSDSEPEEKKEKS